jgi:Domain of unknown function (DUF2828).
MLNYLKEETNLKNTENGGITHKSSMSSTLDYFAQCGALRLRREEDIINLFSKALGEDALISMKLLFYTRGIRSCGLGERRTFQVLVKYLANNHTEIMRKNIGIIPLFGRWDDVYALFDTPLENEAIALIKKQLEDDILSENPSLMAKWLKSENTSSKESVRLAVKTYNGLGMTPRTYRKTLSKLRKRIGIIETKITNGDYESIDYSKIPSNAGLKYRSAFYEHDEERYTSFLQSLSKGEVKVNSSTLFPYELVGKVLSGDSNRALLNGMWEQLNYIKNDDENSLAVVDVSGSMCGTPMQMAISLGLYLAEKNKGAFANHFMTFSANPELVEVKGVDFYDKVRNISRANWGMNTDINATFDLILNTAIKNKIPQEDIPSRIFVISDMEFDEATNGYWDRVQKPNFQVIKEKFEKAGYTMPRLVFWNVCSVQDNIPMTMNDDGVQLVSGATPYLFELLLENKFVGAYELMLQELNKEIYDCVRI